MRNASKNDVQGRVAAVLVTYNRKELLCECLDALLCQTTPIARIVLVDNASTDGTPELLAEKGYLENAVCDYHRMAVNTGGAGGFYEGVKRAYEAGFDWLWLMDDDVEPVPNALKKMLSHANVSECIQAVRYSGTDSRKIGRDGQTSTNRVAALPRRSLRALNTLAHRRDASRGC